MNLSYLCGSDLLLGQLGYPLRIRSANPVFWAVILGRLECIWGRVSTIVAIVIAKF